MHFAILLSAARGYFTAKALPLCFCMQSKRNDHLFVGCVAHSNDLIDQRPVLRIHDILGWIRIRILGSMPLTNGSRFGSGSWIRTLLFSTLTFKMTAKNLFFNTIFSAYYFLKLILHHFSKIKSQKESQNSRNQCFS